jgi:hypothetical protein
MAVIDDLKAIWELSDLNDAHGSHTLTNNNTATFVTGHVGDAVDFERDSAQFLNCPSTTELETGDVDMSLAGWAYMESQPGHSTILSKDSASHGEYILRWDTSAGRFKLFVYGAASFGSAADVTDTNVISTATWYFVVVWHDATANTINIQVNNGTPVSTSHSAGIYDNDSAFKLGNQGSDGNNKWDGRLDQWGVWKKVLTSDERTWLYNSGAGRSYADIVAEGSTLDTFRPSATASAGSWTAQPSGTLHGVTSDESDSTAARSSAGAGSDTLDLSFPAMGTPDAGTVTFYIRHQRT